MGHRWEQWKHHMDYVDYVVVAIIVVAIPMVAGAVPAGAARQPRERHAQRSDDAQRFPPGLTRFPLTVPLTAQDSSRPHRSRLGPGARDRRDARTGGAAADLLLRPRRADPWLLGWDASPTTRGAQGLRVALHAGTAAALLVILRGEVIESARNATPTSVAVVALSLLPPVVVGFALEKPIERHLGGPGSIAVGLIAGAPGAGALRPRAPAARLRRRPSARRALAGVAQACALFPRRLAQRRDPDRGAAARLLRASTPNGSHATWRCR